MSTGPKRDLAQSGDGSCEVIAIGDIFFLGDIAGQNRSVLGVHEVRGGIVWPWE